MKKILVGCGSFLVFWGLYFPHEEISFGAGLMGCIFLGLASGLEK